MCVCVSLSLCVCVCVCVCVCDLCVCVLYAPLYPPPLTQHTRSYTPSDSIFESICLSVYLSVCLSCCPLQPQIRRTQSDRGAQNKQQDLQTWKIGRSLSSNAPGSMSARDYSPNRSSPDPNGHGRDYFAGVSNQKSLERLQVSFPAAISIDSGG